MTLAELIALSLALGTDLLSVAIPVGMNRLRLSLIIRSALIFAGFHIVMIIAGYYAGHWLGIMVEQVETYHIYWSAAAVQDWASAIGGVILGGLGIHMIKENLFGKGFSDMPERQLQGFTLLALALSVSVDALGAGFSMGMMDVDLVKLSVVLGSIIFLIAVTGLGLGRHIGRLIGTKAEIIGGVVLIILSAHILWTAIRT